MENCRMCERKLFPKEKDVEDGLCTMCHISLCQEGVIKCSRCTEAIEKLIAWATEFKPDESEETPEEKFDKELKENFNKIFDKELKENFNKIFDKELREGFYKEYKK